jgi:superfamily II DNA or RNA helicase
MSVVLRDYQREAIDDTFARWQAGAQRVPVVLATGLGKSVIQSHLAHEWLNANPGQRVLVIAHTIELIDQMVGHMRKTGRRVGVVMGARNVATAEIVVASRQTLGNAKRLGQLRNVGMIMIDECHFAVRANTYGRILEHFGAFEDPPRVKVAGFTATLSRSDKQKLSTIWEDCTFSRDISFGIRNGFLMDVRGARIVVDELDMRNVATRGGDWDAASLGEELERSFAVETIAKRYLELSEGRKGLAFWPLVSVAQHAAEVFNDLGIPSGVVWGAQDKRERAAVLAAHKAGEILCVHNAMALTVGYDDPGVDVILMGRNTKSRGLYVQMAGRGLRPPIDPETGKPVDARTLGRSALIIDVTGASKDNDLSLFIDLSPERPVEQYEEHPDASLGELEELLAGQIEAEIEEQRAGASWEFESDDYDGAVATKAFDPLARDKAWGVTDGGFYFVRSSRIAKGDSFVFLIPSLSGPEGTWDVAGCSRNTGYDPNVDAAPEWATGTAWVALPLEQAMLHSEGIAGDAYNTKKNSWANREPGKHLKIAAWRAGVPVDGMTHGQLRDAVDRAVASQRIDALVARVRSSVQESSVNKSGNRENVTS